MSSRVREWAVPVLLAAAIALGLVRIAIENADNQDANREITCQSARANIDQLTALHEIADQLGVPVEFRVPEVPPECNGF
jgi:hypothetical protein